MSRIPLVEDNPDVRLVVEYVLIDEGYEVDLPQTSSKGTRYSTLSRTIFC